MAKELTKILLTRLYEIDNHIRRGYIGNNPVNKRTLSNELEISQKTIQRDLDYLKIKYDAPIEYNSQTRNLYYSKEFTLSPLTLNEGDFFSLAVTEKVLKQYKGTVYENQINSFYEKINSIFGGKEKIRLENIRDLVSFRLGPVKNLNKKVFDTLEKAITNQKVVSIEYSSLRLKSNYQREFAPYHLRNYKGEWYLIGYDYSRKKIRVLNVARIVSIEIIRKKTFEIIEGFSINDYFMYSFGKYAGKDVYDVRIKIFPQLSARIKENIWHHTQTIKEFKDGSITISFRLNSLEEIKNWVLQHGRDCKVISPKKLSDSVKEELKAALRLYN